MHGINFRYELDIPAALCFDQIHSSQLQFLLFLSCKAWEGDGVVASARKLIGATNPLQAEPGTIRGDLAVQTGRSAPTLFHVFMLLYVPWLLIFCCNAPIYQISYDGVYVSGMLFMEVIVLITASVKSVSLAIIEYDGSMLLLGDFLSQ